MVPIKRRSFLQGIGASIFGTIVALKGRGAGLEHLEGQQGEVLATGKEEWQYTEFLEWLKRNHYELDIPEHKEGQQVDILRTEAERDEAVDKAIEDMRPSDGKYLDADEVRCLRCYRWIPIEKGFYAPGDRIECSCGNRARFVLFAKVEMESNHGKKKNIY